MGFNAGILYKYRIQRTKTNTIFIVTIYTCMNVLYFVTSPYLETRAEPKDLVLRNSNVAFGKQPQREVFRLCSDDAHLFAALRG